MKNFCLWMLSLGVLTALAAGPAGAQYQLPSSRPAISPYLNLLRSGATQGENYYNLVRPQIEFGSSINKLDTQTTANRNAINSLEAGPAGQYVTGHRTGFMTQSRFFMNNGSGGAGPRQGQSGHPGSSTQK